MSRFFVDPSQVGPDVITIEDKNDLRHMDRVLRLKAGDSVDISDGDQWEYRTQILSLDREQACLKILDKQKCATEPRIRITLYQGIPKQGKMETIVQKCVELGVYRIVPVFMDRTVVVDKGNFGKKIDRWQKVSAEAVKQCRRGIIPEVTEAVRMPQVLEALGKPPEDRPEPLDGENPDAARKTSGKPDAKAGYDLVLIPYENEEGTTIKDVLRQTCDPAGVDGIKMGRQAMPDHAGFDAGENPIKTEYRDSSDNHRAAEFRDIALLIGPEGGFSRQEVDAVIAAGGRSVSLGRTTLRTETAGMAALAMIMYELEL